MAALGKSAPDPDSDDPYARLGLGRDAGFEQVQAARDRCLAQLADDQARAKVEAAYDAVLMSRLRERQQGQVSAAAATASQREESGGDSSPSATSLPGVGVLQRLRTSLPDPSQSLSALKPQLSLVDGQGRVVRLVSGFIGVALLLVSVGSVQLVLALGSIGVFLSQIRRGRRPLASLGWTVMVLLVGLLVGSLLITVLAAASLQQDVVSPLQIQALPAALMLWAAALLLA